MLEDRTGQLDGSDFEDVHDRVRLTLRCTQNAQTHTVYMIYDRTKTAAFNFNYPLAVLDFGPNGRLGTVSFKTGVHTPMKQYLIKVSTTSKVHARKFIAQDGQEYQWSWRIKPGEEWTRIPRSMLQLEACGGARVLPVIRVHADGRRSISPSAC